MDEKFQLEHNERNCGMSICKKNPIFFDDPNSIFARVDVK